MSARGSMPLLGVMLCDPEMSRSLWSKLMLYVGSFFTDIFALGALYLTCNVCFYETFLPVINTSVMIILLKHKLYNLITSGSWKVV